MSHAYRCSINLSQFVIFFSRTTSLYDKIHALVLQNEDLRQHETQFKIQCRNEMSELQEEIR